MSILRRIRGYCPHPPLAPSRQYPLYYKASWLTFQIRDFESSLDGLVGFAILYGILFLFSLFSLPQAGVTVEYQLELVRAGTAIVISLALIYLYARWRGVHFFSPGTRRVRRSTLESLLVVIVWGSLWRVIGVLSNTYAVGLNSGRLAAAPLSLVLGFLSGLVIYGYCAPRLQYGVGKLLGLILSSCIGVLPFLVASIDYPLTFLPLVILLVYIGIQTDSAVGPIIITTLVFGVFYAWSVTPPLMGSLQPTFGSVAAAVLAGLLLVGATRLRPLERVR